MQIYSYTQPPERHSIKHDAAYARPAGRAWLYDEYISTSRVASLQIKLQTNVDTLTQTATCPAPQH